MLGLWALLVSPSQIRLVLAAEKQVNDQPSDFPADPRPADEQVADTLLARYNDIDSVHELLRQQGDQVAAIVVEPIAGNMGVVPPAREWSPSPPPTDSVSLSKRSWRPSIPQPG